MQFDCTIPMSLDGTGSVRSPAAYVSSGISVLLGGKPVDVKRGTVIRRASGFGCVFVLGIQVMEIVEPGELISDLWKQIPQALREVLEANDPAVLVWTPEEGLRLKVCVFLASSPAHTPHAIPTHPTPTTVWILPA